VVTGQTNFAVSLSLSVAVLPFGQVEYLINKNNLTLVFYFLTAHGH